MHHVWIRVGSVGRAPVWCVLPVVLHRPLPVGGIVTRAKVFRQRVGLRYRWRLQLTVDTMPAPRLGGGDKDPVGTCGIDIGWRKFLGEGLRVAYLAGDDGHTEDLRLPERLVQAFRKVDSISSIRDRMFNKVVALLRRWVAHERIPEWLKEDLKHVDKWRSQRKLAVVIRKWTDNRFREDASMYPFLIRWRKRDRHLCFYAESLRDQVQAGRLDLYRKFAYRVAQRYGTAVLEKMDLREFQRLPRTEDDPDAVGRWYRKIACLHTLRDCLKHKLAVVNVDAADTTRTCIACGLVETFDAAVEVVHTWACGHTWDQDEGAARNILARGSDMAHEGEVLAEA